MRPTPSVADPTTPNPWPADLTPEQAADAQAALAAYYRAWVVSDQVYADPSMDWESTIRQAIADPYAALVLESLASLSENQLRTTGSNDVEAVVTGVVGSGNGTRVMIAACVDSSGTDLLNSDGKSVKAPLAVGPRIKQTGVVYKFADSDGGWLVSEVTASDPYEPC